MEAIIRVDPAITALILLQVPEVMKDRNLDHVINAGKQATGAPIVQKLVVAIKEISLSHLHTSHSILVI